jgi:outer membrane protein assembly factor BamB
LPAAPGKEHIRWSVELPGTGHGSPSVWDERLYLMTGDEASGERRVVCLSAADGSLRWMRGIASPKSATHKFNSPGACTPAVDAGGCVVTWAGEEGVMLIAFSPDGEERWRRNLGRFDSDHGGGTSPLLVQGLVILVNDQRGESSLIAVDRATGADRWRMPRRSEAKGTGYGLPAWYEEPGQAPQLVFASRAHGFTGVDPASGRVLWELPDAFPQRVVASVVRAGELVIAVSGEGMGCKQLVAARPGASDGQRKPEIRYTLTRGIPYVPTPLVLDGRLYGAVDGTGLGTCHRADTGELVWQERLGSGFFGSPVAANGVIYLLDKEGTLVSFRAGDRCEALGRLPLGEVSYATPAIAHGRLYCRTLRRLVAIGAR